MAETPESGVLTVEKLKQRLNGLLSLKEQLANAYQQTEGKIELLQHLIATEGLQGSGASRSARAVIVPRVRLYSIGFSLYGLFPRCS